MIRILTTLLLTLPALYAQATRTATLVGTVTDPTGANIVGAKVTAVNTETSFKFEGQTSATGDYYIPYLPSGSYQVEVEAAGFKKHVRSGILLRVGESPRIDVQLEIGALTEAVTIKGAAPLLETETSSAGGLMENRMFMRIPVLQMRTYNIMTYLPGLNVTGFNSFNVIGQRSRSMGYTLDGVSAKDPVFATSVSHTDTVQTSTDALQEVKLFTTGVPAEFGRAGAGVLTAVFKSGTNDLHGAAEDRYINNKLLHRRYFDQLPQTPVTYHELAFTIGGPIVLPKIYDGRNRTFFLFAAQRHHEKASETAITTVPSADMLAGDFSFGGKGLPIYDPITARQNAAGTWIRDPFPLNRVPAARFDQVAKNFLSNQPFNEANQPGYLDANGPHENLVVPTRYRSYRTRFDGKIDHQVSSAHKIFGRYSHNRHRAWGNRSSTHLKWQLVNTETVPQPSDMRNAVFSDTYTLNPTTINEFRLGFTRRVYTRSPEAVGQGWAKKLGLPNVGPETFPAFNGIGFAVSPGSYQYSAGQDFTLSENLTKVLGRHTLKAGYELFRSLHNDRAGDLPSGAYNLGGTNLPFTPNTGNGFASFLLGSVTSASFSTAQATWLPRWTSHGLYIQDDFKPIKSLTLNLGLRWSYESPYHTKWGQQSQFDPAVKDPLTGLMGAITHSKGALATKDLNNFQPRVGMAWTFRPKLVFRGNFGVMTQDLLSPSANLMFEEYYASASVQPAPGDPRIAFLLSQGPPVIRYTANPDGTVPFVGANYSGRGASWWDPNMRMPYIMNWSSGIQYQFASQWLVDVTYQGSAGVGLLNSWNTNVVPLNVSTNTAVLDQIYQAGQNYKPYTQFGSITHWSNYGHNSYHGGTLRVEKRYSSGTTLNAFYTFSKNLDEADGEGGAGGLTFGNRRLEKGRTGYDITHRFVATFQYELPIGHGRRFLSNRGILSRVIGNWDLTYVQVAQSGLPFTMGFNGSPSRYLPSGSRPNQVQPNDQAQVQDWSIGPNRFPTSAQTPYLNIAAFQYPAAYTVGSLGRNTFNAPATIWNQGSLSKEVPIRERLKFIIRWDMSNIFKRPQFSRPNSTYDLRSPGSFARFTGEIGNFAEIGSRCHSILVARLEW
ncbi:MAG: TonB-dependent receptor [Acidobacteria bacterium]|nr:TonB-dependent receptor [Acidobacteriota bacterium]